LLLRRTLVRTLLGLAILGNAANLLIFNSIGLTRANPPIVRDGETIPQSPYADPTAQALILTAIVISFAVIAFTLTLAYRVYETSQIENLSELNEAER
jgi:multicomponent Na+:H+ antiporter subunit C